MNILCIGNSFSVDTTWLIPHIANDLGLEGYHFGNLYVGGCSLNMHLHHLESDAPVYKFYESRVRFTGQAVSGIGQITAHFTTSMWQKQSPCGMRHLPANSSPSRIYARRRRKLRRRCKKFN